VSKRRHPPLIRRPFGGKSGDSAMPDFKIAAAQVASVRGDIDRNIATHAAAMAAAQAGISALAFPELSMTGYEPDLAAEIGDDAGGQPVDLC
jgi:predicted amidohydrolase